MVPAVALVVVTPSLWLFTQVTMMVDDGRARVKDLEKVEKRTTEFPVGVRAYALTALTAAVKRPCSSSDNAA